MRRIFKSRKRALIAILATVTVTGVAFAAWTIVTASGTGNGGVGSLAAPTITGGTGQADTFPTGYGSPTGTLSMSINNPNPSTLYLQSFAVDDNLVTNTPSSPNDASCDWGGGGAPWRNVYLFVGSQGSVLDSTGPSTINLGVDDIAVPPGVSQVDVPNVIGLLADTPSVCQGTNLGGFTITNATFSTADTTP